ncbi:hypothetical protein BB560_003129 [Smittium megazygosporum]|uniref:Anaphase-promoting complex subunit 4 WD40 domain-containing protein n=1 Tax=Smittium megazygosporum TaxID=133381 RepID=A0A2T9ZCV4_9FUNG|nr:hypothetical protein BB560_003129 [Smittium megazygosporum]
METRLDLPFFSKITSVSWLYPNSEDTCNDSDLYFIVGTSGQVKEVSLWSVKNPDFLSDESIANSYSFLKGASFNPQNDVLCLEPNGKLGVFAGSSEGEINFYQFTNSLNDDQLVETSLEGCLLLENPILNDFSASSRKASCTAISSQLNLNLGSSIVACDYAGFVSFIDGSEFVVLSSKDVDLMGLTDIQWKTSHEFVVSSLSGFIRIMDTRSKNICVQTFQENDIEQYPVTAIDIHPSLKHLIASVTGDGKLFVYDARNNKRVSAPPRYISNEYGENDINDLKIPYWDVQFNKRSPDNIVVCSEDGILTNFEYKISFIDGSEPIQYNSNSTDFIKGAVSINSMDINNYIEKNIVLCGTDSNSILLRSLNA